MFLLLAAVCTGCGSSRVNYVGTTTEEISESESADSESAGSESKDDYEDVIVSDSDFDSDIPSDSDNMTDELAVYVCGAVNVPGVYYFKAGDIKSAALEAAGGFADGAAADYVNLAEKLTDGEKLYFPYEEEVASGEIRYDVSESGSETVQDTSNEGSGKVNINTADKTELMTLPGIGESKANLIIDYRESNGSFGSIEDIMNINGIKDGVYGKIKEYITVN
jgi:competence protein ComEA